MKRVGKVLSLVLAAIAVCSMAACGGEKDEWNGEKVTNATLAQTAQVQSGIVNPPTVVCDLSTKDAYEKVTGGGQKPASVILRLNEHFNVVDENDEKLCSFYALYGDVLKDKIIPIVYLSGETDVQTAKKLFTERYDLLDAAVMSDHPEYVKSVREACPKIRGAVEFKTLGDVYDAVRLTNSSYASVAVLSQSAATMENVYYIQSRFRTVWVRPSSSEKGDLYEAINSGAGGIISEDYRSVIKTLGEYNDYAMTRMPFVVAHRGLPNTYNENSVAGIRAAIEAGASHLEVDGYLTTDNRIAILHDGTVDRVSDGAGETESFTLAQIQQFNLDLKQPQEPIPSLDDIFEAMEGSKAVLLFEIKSQKVGIVNALKTALEAHHMERQVVVITYFSHILQAMKAVLPEIPTADLTSISDRTMENVILSFSELNTATSAAYPKVTTEMNAAMRDRGIIGWYWTYNTVDEMVHAMADGFVGLTTNAADKFVANRSTKYVFVKGDTSVTQTPVAGEEIALIGVTYKMTEEKIKGKVFYAQDLGDRYAVIASYSTAGSGSDSPIVYTQTYYLSK